METHKTIQYIAISAALIIAPLVTLASAQLLNSQSGNITSSSAKLVKAPIQQTEVLPADIVSQIAESISLLDNKS